MYIWAWHLQGSIRGYKKGKVVGCCGTQLAILNLEGFLLSSCLIEDQNIASYCKHQYFQVINFSRYAGKNIFACFLIRVERICSFKVLNIDNNLGGLKYTVLQIVWNSQISPLLQYSIPTCQIVNKTWRTFSTTSSCFKFTIRIHIYSKIKEENEVLIQ